MAIIITKLLHQPMLNTLVFNFMLIFCIISPPTFTNSIPFRLELTHVDAGKNFSNHELLQRALQRSMARNAMFKSKHTLKHSHVLGQASNIPVKFSLGEYLFDVAIGTPPKLYSLLLDTGSDITWIQCNPCFHCQDQPVPLFNATASSSYSLLQCSNPLCKVRGSTNCQSKDVCLFFISYADGAFASGTMARETFTFGSNTKPVSVPHVGFGCAILDQGTLFNGAGVAGFSREKLSIISQLQVKKFSYCFTPFNSSKKSHLFFDELADIELVGYGNTIKSTAINSTLDENYYVLLKGVTVGSDRVSISSSAFEIKANSSVGIVVDSGTQYTILETVIYEAVTKAFVSQIKLPLAKPSGHLEFCFKANSKVVMPKLVLHFDGADMTVPQDNYFIELQEGLHCLAFMDGGQGFGALNIIGNFFTQNIYVQYDLQHNMLSWVSATCENL